jgi:hypothetical protein
MPILPLDCCVDLNRRFSMEYECLMLSVLDVQRKISRKCIREPHSHAGNPFRRLPFSCLRPTMKRQRYSGRRRSGSSSSRWRICARGCTFPGMSAAIARDGAIIWAAGFGYADPERRVQADTNSVYQLASLTKPYAATVVAERVIRPLDVRHTGPSPHDARGARALWA